MAQKNLFTKFKVVFLDLLFPRFCVSCGIEGTWLCASCKEDIVLVKSQLCAGCQRLSPNGRYCPKCRKGKALKGIIVASYYEEGPIREMIHNFKYNSVTELDNELVDLLYQAFKNFKENNIKIDIITFAPLHSARLAQRGYNQAEILANKLSGKTKIEVKPLLYKNKKTKRQVELTGKKRRENLLGVFGTRMKNLESSVKNKKILIIDDITTTGTTLNECAKVLKDAGAKEIWGLVVARG